MYGIYTYIGLIFMVKVVAEYTNRPMDSMGSTSANIRISGSVGFQPLENSEHPCFVNGQIMDVHTWRIISGIVYHTYFISHKFWPFGRGPHNPI